MKHLEVYFLKKTRNDTMMIHLIIFDVKDVLPTMVCLIVDSPTAILHNVCLPDYLLLTWPPQGMYPLPNPQTVIHRQIGSRQTVTVGELS